MLVKENFSIQVGNGVGIAEHDSRIYHLAFLSPVWRKMIDQSAELDVIARKIADALLDYYCSAKCKMGFLCCKICSYFNTEEFCTHPERSSGVHGCPKPFKYPSECPKARRSPPDEA